MASVVGPGGEPTIIFRPGSGEKMYFRFYDIIWNVEDE